MLIELRNINFSYNDSGEKALEDVSLTLTSGNCYTIEGPNGCGKSTLFRIMMGLEKPESGIYRVDGEEITPQKLKKESLRQNFYRRMGFLFQNCEIQLFTQTVEDEIAFGLEQLRLPESEIHARVERYLERFQLQNLRNRAPFHLSGGEKKRLALAAVLAMEPEAILMDEPISGLDEEGQRWVSEFLLEMKAEGRLMVIATHNRALAQSVADVRITMQHGRVQLIEKPQ
jgi:cobalt/nickel transport system ATP-binding protein